MKKLFLLLMAGFSIFSAVAQPTDAAIDNLINTWRTNTDGQNTATFTASVIQAINDGKVSRTEPVTGTGSSNTYAVTVESTIVNFTKGFCMRVKFPATNSGASTINVNGLGAKDIKKVASTVLASGDITNGQVIDLCYDVAAGYFKIVGSVGSGGGGGATDFTDLGDVPSTYTDKSLQNVRVDSAGTGLEFTNDPLKKKTLGVLFNNDGAFTGGNYTQTGTTFTINASTISGNSGGVAGTYTNHIDYNYVTLNQNYTLEATYTLGTVGAASTGLGFGIDATGVGAQVGYLVVYDCSNGADAGKIKVYGNLNGTYTLQYTTPGAVPAATSDVIQVRLISGKQKGIIQFKNVTQNKSVSWTSIGNLALNTTPTDILFNQIGNFNIGKFAIWNFGFQGSISKFKVTSTEIKGANYVAMGDSQTKGANSMMPNETWTERLAQDLNVSVVTEAGAATNSADMLTAVNEVIALAPEAAILLIGTNDIGGVGGATITDLETNLPTIITALQGAGIRVYLPELVPRGLSGIATHNTWLRTNYPTLVIPTYQGMTDGASPGNMLPAYSSDNLHPNTAGQYALASLIEGGLVWKYDHRVASNPISIPVSTIGNILGRNLTIGTNDAFSPVFISGTGRHYFNTYDATLLGAVNLEINSSNINDGLFQSKNLHASGWTGTLLVDPDAVSTGAFLRNNSSKIVQMYADGGSSKLQLKSYNNLEILVGNSYTKTVDFTTTALTALTPIVATKYQLSALNTAPSSASDTGTAGEIRIDASFIYICVATNTWKRVAIATW